MLSAFRVDNKRLQRLDLEEGDALTDALWVDISEPEEHERQLIQTQFNQELATSRNWMISKPPRVSLRTMTGFTSTPFLLRRCGRPRRKLHCGIYPA